jgi:hypothetical protein
VIDRRHHSLKMWTLSSEIRLRVSATEASRTFALVSQEFSGVVIMTTIEDVHSRLRAEFSEMPGMRLTLDQVQRLCGVERALCRLALDALVASEFLCVKADGHYVRVTDGGDTPRRFRAKADIRVERRIARAS